MGWMESKRSRSRPKSQGNCSHCFLWRTDRIYPDGHRFTRRTILAVVWWPERPGYSFYPCSSLFPIQSFLLLLHRHLLPASLPLSSQLDSLSRCLTCLTLLLPSLTRVLCKTALCPSRPSTGSIPGPSVQLWEGAPTPPCRAPLRCSPPGAQPPPAPALCSLRFGLLVSVSKVTPTASRSSPELPAGFPNAVHQLGSVPHCLSQFSRTFLHPATASALGEHRLHLAKGKAGLRSTFSPEKFPRNSGLSIQDHSKASWLSWRPSGRPRAAPSRRGGFPRGLPSESCSSWWESGQQESKRAHTAFLSLLLAAVAAVGAGAGSAPDRSPAVPVPSPQ